jgi:hypothetical protein
MDEILKSVQNIIDKNGQYLFYKTTDFKTPLFSGSDPKLLKKKIIDYVRKNPKYIDKIFVSSSIKIKDNKIIVSCYQFIVDDEYTIEQPNNHVGNEIWYSQKYLSKYGFDFSDIKKIYKALLKFPDLSIPINTITIEKIYETLGETPKKHKDTSNHMSSAMTELFNKIKKKISVNGQYRIYDSSDFSMPILSSAIEDDVQSQLLKYVRKNKDLVDKIFIYADINIDYTKNKIKIIYKQCFVNSKNKIKYLDEGTVIYSEDYLNKYGFKFADIERVYLATTKNEELFKNSTNIKIEKIDEIVKSWVASFIPNGVLCN